jgi:tetratricopeptide (TPR) repeat protein
MLRELDPEGGLGLREASAERLLAAARACYGLPRALEAVAGLLANDPTLTLEQLLGNAPLFTGQVQVVENLVAEHYAALGDERRRVLEALAVYGKAVPAAAVRFLLQPFFPQLDAEERLGALARNYFLTFHRGRGQGTYELHPIDQQHAYAQIPEQGAYSKGNAHRRAAEFYAAIGKPEVEWQTLEDLQPQLDEFEQRVRAGDFDQAAGLLARIDYPYLAIWGYSDLVIGLRERLVGRLGDAWAEMDNRRYLGYAYNRVRAVAEAVECFEAALRLLGEAGEAGNRAGPGGPVNLKGNLGRSYLLLGRVEEARVLFEEALEAAREYRRFLGAWGSRMSESVWLGRLAEALLALGRTEEALELLQTAAHISQVEGDNRWGVSHFSGQSRAHRKLGNYEAALRYAGEGLDRALRTCNRQGAGYCALRRAQALHELGRLAEARGDYERGKQVTLPPIHYACSVRLGILCLEEGKAAEAGENFALGISLCRVLLARAPGLYDALYLLALAQLGSGATEEALATYRRAVEACSAKGAVQDALRDLRLLERSRYPVPGLASAIVLLEEED